MVNILFSQSRFHEDWAKNEIQKYINKDDKLAIMPFSFNEEWISNGSQYHDAYDKQGGKYYKEIVEPFLMLGINEDNIIWLNYFEDSIDEMKNKVESSDIVFLTGGLPDKAAQRVYEKHLVNCIKNCRVVMGISAGALMQLQDYYLSPDDDYPEFNYYKGIDLIKDNDFYIEVHYEDTDVQNDCIKRVLKEKADTVYAIKNDGGVIVDNGNITLLGNVVTYTNRKYFMKTERIGFSKWTENDLKLASSLWGEKEVTHFICATGEFTDKDIKNRLQVEINNDKKYGVQYWPIFNLETNELIGCCGLRPFNKEKNSYEIGFHLKKECWGKGYATEASKAVINYCFKELKADKIFAGHHPKNTGSKKVLGKLNFKYIGDNFYEPTGLYHPSYEMVNPEKDR